MTESFKNCPFCNGEPTLSSNYSYKTRCYFVMAKCTFCGSQGKIFSCKDDPEDANWNNDACINAVKAWNMRVSE